MGPVERVKRFQQLCRELELFYPVWMWPRVTLLSETTFHGVRHGQVTPRLESLVRLELIMGFLRASYAELEKESLVHARWVLSAWYLAGKPAAMVPCEHAFQDAHPYGMIDPCTLDLLHSCCRAELIDGRPDRAAATQLVVNLRALRANKEGRLRLANEWGG